MRAIKWISLIALITCIAFGTLITYQTFTETTNVARSHQPLTSSATIISQQDHTVLPELPIHTETENTGKYTMSITMPTSSDKKIHEPIHQWIKQQKESFLTEIHGHGDSFIVKHPAYLNIQLQSSKIEKDIYSLQFTVEKYIDKENSHTDIQPFMVNMQDKKIMKLADIYPPNEQLSEELYTIVRKQIDSDEKLKPLISMELLQESIHNIDQLKWTIDNENLSLYFNKNEITSEATGPITFDIPLEQIRSFSTEYISEELATEQDIPEHNEKYVALTFDDGPDPTVTPQILKTLNQFDAKATFFMLGHQVINNKDVAKLVAENGHEVANHSMNHPDLTKLAYGEVVQQFNGTHDEIEQATGIRPSLVRPPFGSVNNNVLTYADHYNNSIALWSVDSLDWKNRNANSVYNIVMQNVSDGAIVLMHDIYPSTADALAKLLDSLSTEGYQFVTVSELLSMQEKNGPGPYSGNRQTK